MQQRGGARTSAKPGQFVGDDGEDGARSAGARASAATAFLVTLLIVTTVGILFRNVSPSQPPALLRGASDAVGAASLGGALATGAPPRDDAQQRLHEVSPSSSRVTGRLWPVAHSHLFAGGVVHSARPSRALTARAVHITPHLASPTAALRHHGLLLVRRRFVALSARGG